MINWLASYPKSGNTWVRMFLQHYATGNADINADILETRSDTWLPHYQAVSALPVKQVDPVRLAALRGAQLLMFADTCGKTKKILKTHNANCHIGGFPIIPASLTSGAVYIIRDPRDVALSYSRYMNHDVDEVIGVMANPDSVIEINGLPQYIGNWSKHVESWNGAKFIRYEDILDDPVKQFSIILDEFGYDKSIPKIWESIEATRLENLQVQESKCGFKENIKGSDSAFFGGGGSRWQKELTVKQAEKVKQNHYIQMRRFGYD